MQPFGANLDIQYPQFVGSLSRLKSKTQTAPFYEKEMVSSEGPSLL